MKIVLSMIALIAFVLVSMPMQSQAVNSMPLVGGNEGYERRGDRVVISL